MVSYYHQKQHQQFKEEEVAKRHPGATTMTTNYEGASATEPTSTSGPKPVKSLVCSPDLSAVLAGPNAGITEPAPACFNADADKPYQCVLCRKNFDQKSAYQSHLRSHGKEGEDPYRCNICGKTFAVPARLTRHYRTHTGEKPYQCEYCNKSFSVKENLSVHRRIHTKERPYKCDMCDRAFEHSGKLHRHMRIHTGERPHKCSVCSKTFIQSGQLVIHMRTHTGEKPYVCKSCGKGFTCSKQLKVHTRTHTGEKPYTCDICGKSFGYNHVLKLHQVAHYGAKVYKCTLCHETFNSKKTMEVHIKTHSDSTLHSPRDSPVESADTIEPIHEMSHHAHLARNGITGTNAATVNVLTSVSSNNKENIKTEEEPCQITTTSPSPTIPVPVSNPYSQPPRSHPAYYVAPYSRGEEQYPVPVNATGLASPPDHPLLTVAAAAAAIEERCFQSAGNPTPPEVAPMYLHSEVTSYGCYGVPSATDECSSFLDLPGNVARRRVEAALEVVEEESRMERQSMLTPPSSNPVSPAPSPDPLDLVIPVRELMSHLPPRKRCKMILESMESERTLIVAQRQNSVIQFAKAS